MPAVTNISTYRFATLSDLKSLRQELITSCKEWRLKGTILLSTEGINLFVAGSEPSIGLLLEKLRSIPGLEGLEPKISLSEEQPFNRMLVRIKREIISFGVEEVRPAERTSPKLSPHELKRWLDEGRPVTLLDTRNDYEVKLGTFKNAIVPDIRTFREFPEAVKQLPQELKTQPVVMFCTGGIRCEKAGPFMEMQGYEQIYQLDGGILKYFEECGGAHYEGECFVFDQRVGVDPALKETGSAVCFVCQAPLDEAEQQDPRYMEGKSCPHCFVSEPRRMEDRIAARQRSIERAASPLPGSSPYVNRRPIHVPGDFDGMTLLETLVRLFPQIPQEEWQVRCAEGRFESMGEIRDASHRVRDGERLLQTFPMVAEPEVSPDIRLCYEDETLLVIHKPAPLPMHASGRFNRNTLQFILNLAYAPEVPRAVHRLDANTTGLVLFARTRHFAKLLQRQFLEGAVEKIYLVKVMGHPSSALFVAEGKISQEPGPAGSRTIDEEFGQPARTEFRTIRRFDDGSALLQATLKSGRTHQIRVHLWQLGHPVIGDATYLADGHIEATQTLERDAPPLQLHAWKLRFRHPLKGGEMKFETELPDWAR